MLRVAGIELQKESQVRLRAQVGLLSENAIFVHYTSQVRGSAVFQDVLQLLLSTKAVIIVHMEQVRWAFESEGAEGSGGPIHRGGHELAGQEEPHHLLPLRGEIHEVRTDSRDLVHSRLFAEEEVCAAGHAVAAGTALLLLYILMIFNRWHEDTLQQFERLHRTRNLLRRKNRNNDSFRNLKKSRTASKGDSGIVDNDNPVVQTTGRRCRRIAKDRSYEEVSYGSATYDMLTTRKDVHSSLYSTSPTVKGEVVQRAGTALT